MRRLLVRTMIIVVGLTLLVLSIGSADSFALAGNDTTPTPVVRLTVSISTITATGTLVVTTTSATTIVPTSAMINTVALTPTNATAPTPTIAPTTVAPTLPPTATKHPLTVAPTFPLAPVIDPPTATTSVTGGVPSTTAAPSTATAASAATPTNVVAMDTPTPSATATFSPTPTAFATVAPTAAAKPTTAPPTTATPATTSGVAWLKVAADTTKDWTLTPDPQDALRATLTAKDPSRFEGAPKKIFVLIPKASPSYDQGMRVMARAFLDKKFAAIFTLVNFNGDAAKGKAALALASSGGFDLILSIGSDATAFVHDTYRNGNVPVVTVLSKDPVLLGQMPNYTSGSGTNIAYTSVNAPLDLQMAYLGDLKPTLKNIAIMYEKSNKSAIETQVEPLRKAAQAKGITVLDVVVNDTTKARAELQSAIPAAIRAMRTTDPTQADSIFWITGSTSVIAEIDAISDMAERVAVLGVFPELVKEGDKSAVLSIGVSFDTNTRLAAAYAIDILSGKVKPGALPVGLVRPPDIAINFLKARQIGLKIPFSFFESASFIYDQNGKAVRSSSK